MIRNLNEKVLSAIENSLSDNKKIISYLTDLLCLSKESVYRRVRGEIPFTFEEISVISSDLDFSIDSVIVRNKKERTFFDLQAGVNTPPSDAFITMLNRNSEIFTQMSKFEDSELIVTLNRLSLVFHSQTDHIFKFFYFRFLHQIHDVPLNFCLSELVVPPKIISSFEKHRHSLKLVRNNTYIIDDNIFMKAIKEILYYHKRNLITWNELLLMREDLFTMLNATEKLIQKGKNEFGSAYSFYLSSFSIDSNYLYGKYNQNEVSQFWVYPANPIIVNNPEVCAVQKKWIESIKKYSTLITQSNEIRQSEFLNTQREQITGMTKMKL